MLIHLVQSYGYWIVFITIACEGVGIPLPGETSLIFAAAMAASGRLSIAGVVVTAGSAAILGDNAGYWIGRKGGKTVLLRYGRLLHVDDSKLEKVHGYFERHGTKTVFLARFVALLRTCAAMFAGVARMPYRSFLLFNAMGGISWAVLYGSLGYAFGENLPALERHLRVVGVTVTACVLLAAVLFFVVRRYRRGRPSQG